VLCLSFRGYGVEQVEGDLLRGLAADGLLLDDCLDVVTNLGFIITFLMLRDYFQQQTLFHQLRLHLFDFF
jgi:hypothetical protein